MLERMPDSPADTHIHKNNSPSFRQAVISYKLFILFLFVCKYLNTLADH